MSMRSLATTSAEAAGPARAATAAQPICDFMPSATGLIPLGRWHKLPCQLDLAASEVTSLSKPKR